MIKSESHNDSHGGGGESDASGVGSMGSADHVNRDDLMQQRSAHHVPGFVGQSSEAKWTETLNKELLPKQEGTTSKSQSRNRGFSQNASQGVGGKKPRPYAEDMDTAVVGNQIDPFSLPVKSTADSLVNAAQKVGGHISDMMTSSEEEAAPSRPGHQQTSLASYDNANQSAFLPRGLYASVNPQEQWQCSGDWTEPNELDLFEFLRAEGGRGSLFPTVSEIEKMGGGQEEDYDMEGGFKF